MTEKILTRRMAEDNVIKAEKELEPMILLRASKTIPKGLADLKVCRAELALKTAQSRLLEVVRDGEK